MCVRVCAMREVDGRQLMDGRSDPGCRDVANGVAEVVVSAYAADTAGRFNMALRRKELRRLRSALWELRVILERRTKESGNLTLTVRHRLEALRSASLDVCHPQQRAADAPAASAIPNFQVVHQDFSIDAVPSPFDSDDDEEEGDAALCDADAEVGRVQQVERLFDPP